MSKSKHPIEQEELMAYLDGELATDRAVEAAAHMEHCAECQELAADLRKLSQEMMAWEVERPETAEMPTDIVVALEKKRKEPRKKISDRREWKGFVIRRWQWIPGLMALGLVIIFIVVPWFRPTQGFLPGQTSYSAPPPPSFPLQTNEHGSVGLIGNNETAGKNDGKTEYSYSLSSTLSSSGGASEAYIAPLPSATPVPQVSLAIGGGSEKTSQGDEEIDTSERTVPSAPMIARTADLTLRTKEFEKTRAGLEEILKRHGGYLGELKVSAPADSGRALTATLRIPAAQFDAAMAELKGLGRVEFESQGGEEVTQQYVDLQARLANGIHTEQRLTEILRQRTGKLQDVLKVELEIDRVRGEIEQMQAEKKELSKRVAFATLNTTVKEEYFAKLQATPPSTGSRFSNAAVDGYNTAVEGLISVGLFLLSSGPSLLIWAAVLFFPVRWLWKRLKKAYVSRRHGDTEEEKAE
jgi:hypothetical protein